MRVFATGVVDGPEARGIVWVVEYEDGRLNVELTDLWVAPGPRRAALHQPLSRWSHRWHRNRSAQRASRHPGTATGATARRHRDHRTLCRGLLRVCSVHFGHGTLDWHDFTREPPNSGNA